MRKIIALWSFAVALLFGTAWADSTSFSPIATGFTLPNAQQAVSASSADYATTAGSAGFATSSGTATSATNANYATASGSAKTAASATTAGSADSATYATSSGVAQQAAGLTAGNTCPAGSALSVTKGVLGCVSSVTSITGNLNGSQIIGSITNATSINIDGNIVSGGNVVATGSVNGQNGLYSGNGVYSSQYYGRAGGSNATFNGTSNSAGSATTLTGQLDGSQIVGNITNVGVIRTSGNITSGGNIVSTGYVNGQNGLYSSNGVYAADYYGRAGGSNANFNGNALTSNTADSATTANTANYAASTIVGILRQSGAGDGSTYSCDSGYYLKFYDTNVDSTNNAFFYECIKNGH